MTCRQVRANIFPYRRELVRRTVRCDRDDDDDGLPPPEAEFAVHISDVRQAQVGGGGGRVKVVRLLTKGRCARDLVGECRRCGRMTCRVCIRLYNRSERFIGADRALVSVQELHHKVTFVEHARRSSSPSMSYMCYGPADLPHASIIGPSGDASAAVFHIPGFPTWAL